MTPILEITFKIFNVLSFLSGAVFGVFLSALALFHFLSANTSNMKGSLLTRSGISKRELRDKALAQDDNNSEDENEDVGHARRTAQSQLTDQDIKTLNQVIDFLHDINSPLKNMGESLLPPDDGNPPLAPLLTTIDLLMSPTCL